MQLQMLGPVLLLLPNIDILPEIAIDATQQQVNTLATLGRGQAKFAVLFLA